MAVDPITAIFETGKLALERIWPDPNKRAEELRLLEELRQKGNLAELTAHVQLMLGQIEVNKEQAKHKSIFVAGARPFVLWVCAVSLAYSGILYEMILWLWTVVDVYKEIPEGITPPPKPDAESLYPLLFGLLGIGGYRTFEKAKGVETNSLKN